MAVVVKSPCIIKSIIRHTDTIATLELGPLKRLPGYQPGQFLHLALDAYDPTRPWPESRVFSIANYDPARTVLKIIFSIKGKYTRRMYNEMENGREVWVKLPYGVFTFKPRTPNMVLVAGGTGITPFLSYLESLGHRPVGTTIHLYYGAQTAQHLICGDMLDELTGRHANLKIIKYLETPDASQPCRAGRLAIDAIISETDALGARDFYLSGPPEMIFSFRDSLIQRGCDRDLIHIDAWQ